MNYGQGITTAGFKNAEEDRLRTEGESEENSKSIDNHIKAAEHFAAASKLHYEAAKYHQEGANEKANQSALFANGHALLGTHYQMADAQNHAVSGK
ncbi:MAG: hypothetical protein PSX36_04565 [bacterium]|nr:hypothetical protein [bacterium]